MQEPVDGERPSALRPFDKATFGEINDRVRPPLNTLKSAGKGFFNQDAIGPLLAIAAVGLEYAHKILIEDPANFDGETTEAVTQMRLLLERAQASDRARTERQAERNFESSIETAASGLADAGRAILGRDLTPVEYDDLRQSMRAIFKRAKEAGGPPDGEAMAAALASATSAAPETPGAKVGSAKTGARAGEQEPLLPG